MIPAIPRRPMIRGVFSCGCRLLATVAAASLLAVVPAAAAPAAKPQHWIAGWVSAPLLFTPGGRYAWTEPYADQTVRQTLRVMAAGDEVRVRLTNDLGTTPIRVGAAALAISRDAAAIDPATSKALTFGGRTEVVIQPGVTVLSDPIAMKVERFTDLAVSIHYPEATSPPAHRHWVNLSSAGEFVAAETLPGAQIVRGPGLASAIEVSTARRKRVIVAFGDSITEGAGASIGSWTGWPGQLARRLAARQATGDWVIVNSGISGGRVLHDHGGPSALARFDRDVLTVAGVTDVVVLEGINDIGVSADPARAAQAITAKDLIWAYQQLISRAHARSLKIYGGTILPYEGAAYASPAGEAARVEVNAWIRTSGAFDGVIDFEAAVRDPDHPSRMVPAFQIGDQLHPTDAGYTAMADAAEKALLGFAE